MKIFWKNTKISYIDRSDIKTINKLQLKKDLRCMCKVSAQTGYLLCFDLVFSEEKTSVFSLFFLEQHSCTSGHFVHSSFPGGKKLFFIHSFANQFLHQVFPYADLSTSFIGSPHVGTYNHLHQLSVSILQCLQGVCYAFYIWIMS